VWRQAPEQLFFVPEFLLAVGDAELHARSLVGDAAVEYENEDVGLQYAGLVQVERGVSPLFGGHGVLRRLLPLYAVPLSQEVPEGGDSSFSASCESNRLSASEKSGPVR